MSRRNGTANILPPPRSLEIKTVKLLTDPVYLSYQSHTATLSLMTSVYVKYAPPAWGPVPRPNSDEENDSTEWKRRIKMYCTCTLFFHCAFYLPPSSASFPFLHLPCTSSHIHCALGKKRKHSTNDEPLTVGPIVEAFGTDRILYASSGCENPADWYELAREVVAELGVEQEAVDAIFGANANGVFGQGA